MSGTEVKNLQKLLVRSTAAKMLAIRQVGLTPKLGHFQVETRFKNERTLSSSLFHPVVGMTAACAVSCPH
ncbi:hypothetical protein, partial [Deinococcus sp. ME38]|uniref:hypothetical protein n=1 Tax=Deinococcus sp. ME38 TaxID=3400344 RepID=UPI003B597711